jgi:heat shock protein 1/8
MPIDSLILGIDFGTTNSCVSYYNINKDEFIVIPNAHGELITPSIIYFDENSNEILYGTIAGKLNGHFSNLKRLIGLCHPELSMLFRNNKMQNINQVISFKIKENLTLSVPEIITIYIKYLVNYACNFIGIQEKKILDIVITIPAYYNDIQREIIKECSIKAGCNVLRIINEPTAAALAYILYDKTPKTEEYVLVFDCGGGTTDLSLLHMDYINQLYEVKNVVGNNFLGGEDITELLVTYFINKIVIKYNISISQKLRNIVKKTCEKIKKELSFKQNVSVNIEFGDICFQDNISQTIFIDICKTFFNKIKKLIKALLSQNSNNVISYTKVIFVGGTSRIPYFKHIFKEFLGDEILINSQIDPDQAISIGASVQGALLKNMLNKTNGNLNDALLVDVIPLSIGIETFGGIMSPIISRNTPIPISRTREFTNSHDFESDINVDIYQGERKFVQDNFFLANFNLSNLPKVEKNNIVIQVTFSIDTSSIITASALLINKTKNKKNVSNFSSVKIIKQYSTKLNRKSLEDILLDAENNKLNDSEMENKILNKIELYNSFKYLLGVFHEKRELIINDSESFLCYEINNLFNKTFKVIQDYINYPSIEILNLKLKFEEKFHSLIFDIGPTFKDSDGLIIDMDSSNIIDTHF